jgi:hypothetical protein
MANISLFNTAVRGFAIALAVAGMQHIFAPELTTKLGFFPKPMFMSDQWTMTIRIFGGFICALALSLLQMPAEGMLVAGIAGLGAHFWHKSFGMMQGPMICAAVCIAGCLGVISKYLTTVTRMIGLPTMNPTILGSTTGLSNIVMKGFSWVFLGMAIQQLVMPQLCWSFYYPAGTLPATNYWLYCIRCFGATILALSAKMMGCPDAGVLTTLATGVLFSNWYHNNISVNPAMGLSLTALGIGMYGLITRRSLIAASPSARRRSSMPIPQRVQ